MKSFTDLRNLFGTLANNSASATLTMADELINDSIRRACSERNWAFLQKSKTDNTVAGQQFYTLPYDYDQLDDVTVTIGTTKYVPREVENQQSWDILNQQTTFQSNFPDYYYIFNGQLGFYPIPSSSSTGAITYNYRRKIVDLSIADYTTGTIVSIANGAKTVTGSGTTWTASMVGEFIRISAPTGDNVWYEIGAVGSTTSLTLVKSYNGTSIAAGSAAYTIGQMPILPEAFHDLPVYDALSVYFSSVAQDVNKANLYLDKTEGLLRKLRVSYDNKTLDPTIQDFAPRAVQNPNLFISL